MKTQHFNFMFYPIENSRKNMVAGRGAQFLKENLLACAACGVNFYANMCSVEKNRWCKVFQKMHHMNFFSMRRMNPECKKCWQKFNFGKLQPEVLIWFVTEVFCPDLWTCRVFENNKMKLIWRISANILSNHLKYFWRKISTIGRHFAKLIKFLIFHSPFLGSDCDRGGGAPVLWAGCAAD